MSKSDTQSIGGTDVPKDIDTTTTAGKLADLKRRVTEVANAGSERAIEKQHARGKKTARERLELLLDEGSVRRDGQVRPAPLGRVRRRQEPPLRRRRRHRLRHGRRPHRRGVRPGLHRLRRLARRGVRREDRQDHGLRHEGRLPGRRAQRLGRGAHPGGCRLARPVRRDLPPQRARVGRHPADLADHGAVRRRRRLLPRGHRLHRHGRPDLAHVHHRARRHQDRHR